MNSMEIAEHIDTLERNGGMLAQVATKTGLDADVPPCPGWTVADLIRHTGYVHRWAARNVVEQPPKVIGGDTEEDILGGGPSDEELLDWFRDGYTALAETLRGTDPAAPAPVFLPNTTSPLGFWARRQAHETAIHRADAELAAGQAPAYDKNFAADGLDELIMGFAARGRRIPEGIRGRPTPAPAEHASDSHWPTTSPPTACSAAPPKVSTSPCGTAATHQRPESR
jgi:uncharacterized protein (TIGR03083 family)